MAHCGALGVYRRRTFVLGAVRCKKGLHEMTGYRARIKTREGSICRQCFELRRKRWYWARQLEVFNWSEHFRRYKSRPSIVIPLSDQPEPRRTGKDSDLAVSQPPQRRSAPIG